MAGKEVSEKKLARVLVQCGLGSPNDVIEVGVGEVDALVKSGKIDVSDAAVAYAKKIQPVVDESVIE